MTVQQLKFVVEVANCASINKAAELLYTHQSNISNSIKQLENELGITIFTRTRKGVFMTDEGREFISYAREIIRKVEFADKIYSRKSSKIEYFTVSSMRSYFLSVPIINLMPDISQGNDGNPLYCRLKKQSFQEVLEDVENRRSDIGIIFLMESNHQRIERIAKFKSLDYVRLGRTQVCLVMDKNHPFSEPSATSDIVSYPYVVAELEESFRAFYDDDSTAITDLFQEQPKCVISTNDSAASQDIVAHSPSFFISSMPWQHSEHYNFKSIPIEGDEIFLVHYYVIRKDQTITPLLQRYIAELEKLFPA